MNAKAKKKSPSVMDRLKTAETVLKGIGLGDDIDVLYAADEATLKAASEKIRRAITATPPRPTVADWDKEYEDLGLPSGKELEHSDTIDEFKTKPPCFCIGEVVSDFTASSSGEEREFRKGQTVVLTGAEYHKLNINSRLLKPAAPTFRDAYRKYDGQGLDGKTLLVWRSGGIGDLIFIRPILCHLKKRYPTCKIMFATKRQYHDLVKYWEDCIDGLADVLFDARGLMGGADYHLTFEGVIERCRDAERMDVHDLFARLAGLDPDDIEWSAPMEAPTDNAFFAGNTEQYALIQCRASTPTRTPFAGTFIAAINECTRRGLRCVVVESPSNVRTVDDLRSACETPSMVVNFAKYTTGLHDMVALVDNAAIVISPDSAFTHMAAMQGKPCLAFYGPFPASVRTERYPHCVALEPTKNNACKHSGRACFLHAHLGQCAKNFGCWHHLTNETVVSTLGKMLDAMEVK